MKTQVHPAILGAGAEALLKIEVQLPQQYEAAKTALEIVRTAEAKNRAPARVQYVRRLEREEVASGPSVNEYQRLLLMLSELGEVTLKAAGKAVRYRVAALCHPHVGIDEQKRALNQNGNQYKTYFWRIHDSVRKRELKAGPRLIHHGENLISLAEAVFQELAEAKATLGFEPRDMDRQLF